MVLLESVCVDPVAPILQQNSIRANYPSESFAS
ncbi:Protein of unknown function [Pyronema omphalodes CBS 100304]|uniref:Uncharacterized protein n=1 Tax=Pyronema omphalodes (strain CBS 100304) TaxID=1076935 RepID=U4LGB0_PYROM|nr:Protein of unknown function [Pyronema omphalodes CBS 100304]